MHIALSQVDSPLGPLQLAVGESGMVALEFSDDAEALRQRLAHERPGAAFEVGGEARFAAEAVRRYFDGELNALDGLAVDPEGTPFQKKVWTALRRIGPGETWSYRQLAAAVGKPTATRAVGAANGRNPIALVVPCHRVIASDGTLGGYAAGLKRKAWLLEHEARARTSAKRSPLEP